MHTIFFNSLIETFRTFKFINIYAFLLSKIGIIKDYIIVA